MVFIHVQFYKGVLQNVTLGSCLLTEKMLSTMHSLFPLGNFTANPVCTQLDLSKKADPGHLSGQRFLLTPDAPFCAMKDVSIDLYIPRTRKEHFMVARILTAEIKLKNEIGNQHSIAAHHIGSVGAELSLLVLLSLQKTTAV